MWKKLVDNVPDELFLSIFIHARILKLFAKSKGISDATGGVF
jgi:hypothetical protein